jgi:hypothetical protein
MACMLSGSAQLLERFIRTNEMVYILNNTPELRPWYVLYVLLTLYICWGFLFLDSPGKHDGSYSSF